MTIEREMQALTDRTADSHAGDHNPPDGLGPIEVFWHDGGTDLVPADVAAQHGIEPMEPGWYWWSCSPGCLPDGDPNGPYPTSKDAYEDALAGAA